MAKRARGAPVQRRGVTDNAAMDCELCGRDMASGDSCNVLPHTVDGRTSDPVPFGSEPGFESDGGGETCHDCGVRLGGFHHIECDSEMCPVDGGQVLGCDLCPEREAWWEQHGHDYRMRMARFMKGEISDARLAEFVRAVLSDPEATLAARRLARQEIRGIDYRAESSGSPREDWSNLPD